ncbi:MAG: trypsin-like serine protease, partial [Oscillospiraceae bacterium]|nr:trypsin-like serine protease [Oscillospiraceae bacterium]
MKKLISAFLCVALMFSLISNPTSAQIITNEAHAIFGEDSRVEANSVNTFPNSASAFVTAAFPNGKSYIGSGVFVGATSVLTAAHVIYSHDDGGWATAVTVTPGGVDSSYSSIPGISLAIATGWSESRDFDYDYGMIRIAQNPGITWFGLRPFADNELAGQSIIRYAFDGDKPRGTLWIDRNSAIVGVTPRSLHHHAASYRGSSGGAIVLADHPTLLAGIHVASSSIDGVPVYNRAVRVTLEIMDFVNRNRSACDTAGHRLSDWETVSVATCTSQGAQTSRCLDCGLRESSTQSAFGHNMGEWERVFEPTCTRDGLQMRRCSLCPFAESDFIERGHVWSDWRYSLPPTLQSPG